MSNSTQRTSRLIASGNGVLVLALALMASTTTHASDDAARPDETPEETVVNLEDETLESLATLLAGPVPFEPETRRNASDGEPLRLGEALWLWGAAVAAVVGAPCGAIIGVGGCGVLVANGVTWPAAALGLPPLMGPLLCIPAGVCLGSVAAPTGVVALQYVTGSEYGLLRTFAAVIPAVGVAAALGEGIGLIALFTLAGHSGYTPFLTWVGPALFISPVVGAALVAILGAALVHAASPYVERLAPYVEQHRRRAALPTPSLGPTPSTTTTEHETASARREVAFAFVAPF